MEAWGAVRSLAVQAKRGKSPGIRAALTEACGGAGVDELPAAVVTFLDRRRPRRLLVLDWDNPKTRDLFRPDGEATA